jgi:hypothetical protein
MGISLSLALAFLYISCTHMQIVLATVGDNGMIGNVLTTANTKLNRVSLYVCVCVCVCVCTNVYTYVCTSTHTYAYIRTHMNTAIERLKVEEGEELRDKVLAQVQ